MYAVIETGGKQYRVGSGDLLEVERLPGEPKSQVSFDQVLMVRTEDGVQIGRPAVENARVLAEIVDQDRAKKIVVFKKKRRKDYRRTQGHRQAFTRVRIMAIEV